MENVVFFHFFLPPSHRSVASRACSTQPVEALLTGPLEKPGSRTGDQPVKTFDDIFLMQLWHGVEGHWRVWIYSASEPDHPNWGGSLGVPHDRRQTDHPGVCSQTLMKWNSACNFLNKSFLNSSTCLWPRRPCMVNRSPLRDDTANGDEIWHYIMLQEDAIFVSTQKEHLHPGKKTSDPLNQIIRHRGCSPASDHFLV